jgi:hypothetical protein
MSLLALAAIVLTATAIGGLSLFALYDWFKPTGRVWPPGAMHGGLGLVGFAMLLAGLLGGPVRGARMGASQFGAIGAALIGAGLSLGAVAFAARLRGRSPAGVVLGIHASLAVGGLVMLAAYLAAPT